MQRHANEHSQAGRKQVHMQVQESLATLGIPGMPAIEGNILHIGCLSVHVPYFQREDR